MSISPITCRIGNGAPVLLKGSAPVKGAPPPCQRKPAGTRQAEFVICDQPIEQFFRTLKKQGLNIEDSQIADAEYLIKLVAVACRAAVLTLQLTQARDGGSRLPISVVFDAQEKAVLDRVNQTYSGRTRLQSNPYPPHSLAWAAWIIARLGGWDGYPSSRPPGPITFKNGIDTFKTMTAGWALQNVCMP